MVVESPGAWQGGMNRPLQHLQSALSFWENKPGQGHHELFSSERNSPTVLVLFGQIFKAIEPLLGALIIVWDFTLKKNGIIAS